MNDTKEYIIDEAYRLFLSKSYEAVSISDISNAIGFTKGALYHHFQNKEELFKAVIDKHLRFSPMGDLKPDITLGDFIRENVEHARQIVDAIHIEQNRFVPVNYLAIIIDAFRHYSGFDQHNLQLFIGETNRIKQVLDHAVETGEIREDIDTQIMALNFFSIAMGIASNLISRSSPSSAIDTYRLQLNEFYKLLKK
jgi:TetR/AcrR family transcriptional repressor of nem operon